MNGDTKIPVLKPRPTLLEVVAMEQGRLARHTFGAPTDPVFEVVTVPGRPESPEAVAAGRGPGEPQS